MAAAVSARPRLPRAQRLLDGRTVEARMLRDTRERLMRYAGRDLSPTVSAVVDQAAVMTMHLARLNRQACENIMTTDELETVARAQENLEQLLAKLERVAQPKKRDAL